MTFCVNYQRQITRQRQAALWLLNEISSGNSLLIIGKFFLNCISENFKNNTSRYSKTQMRKYEHIVLLLLYFNAIITVSKSSTQGKTRVLQVSKNFSCVIFLHYHGTSTISLLEAKSNIFLPCHTTTFTTACSASISFIKQCRSRKLFFFCFTDSGKQTRSSFSLMSNIHLMLGGLKK